MKNDSNLDSPLFCRVSKSVKKRLDSYVYDKFGTSYGLSRIVNEVLENFLDSQPHPAHTHMKKEAFRSSQKLRSFFAAFPEFENIQRIVDSDLNVKIAEFFGLDPRTRKKYFTAMLELGVLKNPQHVQGGRRTIYDVDLSVLGIEKVLEVQQ